MARSRKHTPIGGITLADSEKLEKRKNHRRERRRIHQTLTENACADVLPHTRELSNPWTMSKDGKYYFGASAEPCDFPKVMYALREARAPLLVAKIGNTVGRQIGQHCGYDTPS